MMKQGDFDGTEIMNIKDLFRVFSNQTASLLESPRVELRKALSYPLRETPV